MVERLQATAKVPVDVHYYDAGHAFFNDHDLIGTCKTRTRRSWRGAAR